MSGSLRIGTLWGIPIRVHWSFGLLVALLALSYQGSGGRAVLAALVWLTVLFGSVVVHELAHSAVARHRGIEVRDIVLLPIGGMSEIADISRSAGDEFWIALVGPLTSFALATAVAVVSALLRAPLWPPTLMAGPFVVRVFWMNVLLGAFNLVPALPLDGGRVLRAALWMRTSEERATETAVAVGRLFGVLMIVLGLFVDLWLALIGLFVVLGAQNEARLSVVRSALAGLTVADVMVAVPPAASSAEPRPGVRTLSPTDPLFPTALEALSTAHAQVLPVTDHGAVVGVLREKDVEAIIRRRVVRNGSRR